MSDITATRDIAIIAILAYAYYKLKDPLADAKTAVTDAAKQAQQTIYLYGGGGELKKAWNEQQEGKTDTEIAQDVAATWTEWMRVTMGKYAPPVPEPPTAADPLTGRGMQETVQILPIPGAQETPTLTPEIVGMIFAPAPDRPAYQVFPLPDIKITPEPTRPPDAGSFERVPRRKRVDIMPIVQPIVPPVTQLIRPTQLTAQQHLQAQGYSESKAYDSMSREQAAAEGWTFAGGAVGWKR